MSWHDKTVHERRKKICRHHPLPGDEQMLRVYMRRWRDHCLRRKVLAAYEEIRSNAQARAEQWNARREASRLKPLLFRWRGRVDINIHARVSCLQSLQHWHEHHSHGALRCWRKYAALSRSGGRGADRELILRTYLQWRSEAQRSRLVRLLGDNYDGI